MCKTRGENRTVRAAVELAEQLRAVFGRSGIQHWQLAGVVHDLSTYAAEYLEHLSSNFKLSLDMSQVRATRYTALGFRSSTR